MAILQTFRGVTFDLATPQGMKDYQSAIANPNFGQRTIQTPTTPQQSVVLTPNQQQSYFASQGNSATPLSPAQYLAQQTPAKSAAYGGITNNYRIEKRGGTYVLLRNGEIASSTVATPEGLKSLQDVVKSDMANVKFEGIFDTTTQTIGSPFAQSQPSQSARDLSISLAQNQPAPQPTPQPQSSSIESTLMQQLSSYLEDLKKRGQVLNPNVQITPEKVAEFTAQAQKEIDPYYATQLKLARESLLRSVGYSQQELDAKEKELEQQYGTDLRKTGENFAEQGFAQSGLRNRAERELATNTQQEIDRSRRALNFGVEGLAQGFAQQYGSRDLPSLSGSSAPTVQAGQSSFTRPSGNTGYYQLSPEIYDSLVGEKQFQQRGAVRSRASELEQSYRQGQSLSEQRQLL